jgi:DNA-binding CsgD family transcriptional regulator
MKITKHLPDTLFRHQQKLEYFGLCLLIFAIGINLDNIRTAKPWEDISFIAMIVLVVIIFVTSLLVRIQKTRTKNLARDIKRNLALKGATREALIDKLSTRQKEILELVMLKMSNNEIMEELSIEHSALRYHIIQIYRILRRLRRSRDHAQ